MLTWLKLAPAFVDRYSPSLVAASTTFESDGSTITCSIFVSLPRKTGSDQVLPPSVDFTSPIPVPSNGSPRPRYRVEESFGSIASDPSERLESPSVIGCQVEPELVLFHTPPSALAT